jgi:hypothetical protein
MSTASSKAEYFSRITAKSDVIHDKNNNEYVRVTIESKQAVTRFNPFTQETEVVPSMSRVTNVNAWKSGVDAPWNHLFDMPVGSPIIGQPFRVNVMPYEIDGNTFTHATLMVPDTENSNTWAKSLATMLRWDGRELAGDITVPVSVVESTDEEVTETKKAKLDV